MNWTLIVSGSDPVGIINQSNKRVCTFSGKVKRSDALLMQYAPEMRELLDELIDYICYCERANIIPMQRNFNVSAAEIMLNKTKEG